MAWIDEYLHAGYGVTLGLRNTEDSEAAHAITCWGYAPEDGGYRGIYITDPDDNQRLPDFDQLQHYDVTLQDGLWHIHNLFDSYDWYIDEVYSLKPRPADVTA
jgi:hypothetical protein